MTGTELNRGVGLPSAPMGLKLHEPTPDPADWMLSGVGRTIRAQGTQVRARQTDDGIEVGAFPFLDPVEVTWMIESLERWRLTRHRWRTIGPEIPAYMLIVGVYQPDDGEDHGEGAHGPGFLMPGGRTPQEDLVDASLMYLRRQSRT